MGTGVSSFSGPIDDRLRRTVMLCLRAEALGFERLDFGDQLGWKGRLCWRTPYGEVTFMDYDELERMLEDDHEQWWAWEAAHWTAP